MSFLGSILIALRVVAARVVLALYRTHRGETAEHDWPSRAVDSYNMIEPSRLYCASAVLHHRRLCQWKLPLTHSFVTETIRPFMKVLCTSCVNVCLGKSR